MSRIKEQIIGLVENNKVKKAAKIKHKKTNEKLAGILQQYRPEPYIGKVILFRAAEQPEYLVNEPSLGWSAVALGGIDIYNIPGDHSGILSNPSLGSQLRRCLESEKNL